MGTKMLEGVVKEAAKHLMNRDMYNRYIYIWYHPIYIYICICVCVCMILMITIFTGQLG